MILPRRKFFVAAAGLCSVPALLALPSFAAAPATEAAPPAISPGFPMQDAELVHEMVGVSHGNVARVRELLAVSPALAGAAWDWGFGDWETALGAASHMGQREIADLLMENGARPDLFTFAMLGQLDVVKAYVAARPGIQKTRGPHGLTLLHHARKGGDASAAVVAYLESLGDADAGYTNAPLTDAEKTACLGDYAFGPAPTDRLTVSQAKDGSLAIKRTPDGANRGLFHLGQLVFHPPGNTSALITFKLAGERVTGLTVTEGGRVIAASRVVG
jgi:hypothetical protein